MAKRTASAKKQARAGARRTLRNRAVRSSVKTLVVKARRSLAESGGAAADASEREAAAVEALSALDRAAAKGILHPRNAARRKSRLARRLAKVAAAAPVATPGSAGGGKGKKASAGATAPAPAAPAPAAKKR